MIFFESDLQFQFSDPDWQIKKYDTHRYFKILSSAGLKGIDFLGIYQSKQVVFFEVKNYHTNQPNTIPKYLIVEDMPAFIEKIIGKVEDTLTAISVIRQYLQRQWWYPVILKIHSFLPSFLIRSKDWYFWHQVQEMIDGGTKFIFILWLEIDISLTSNSSLEALSTSIQPVLEKALKAYPIKVIISNMHQPIFNQSLQVTKKQD